MTPEILFDKIINHYESSKNIIEPYQHEKLFRDRQHGISSVLEDLFAHFLQKYLAERFPKLDLYFMIDYGINLSGEKMIPDIAVIINNHGSQPILASYLDIKTDLGYKRNYFSQFEFIREKVLRLRSATFIGLVGEERKHISISSALIWRTIVISDRNISSALLRANKENAEKSREVFSLYFLSGDSHPNSKQRDLITIYKNEFSNLLNDIEQDIKSAMIIPTLESIV